jgi:peptidoglycan/LPS O-acetylase OafA/YrhL
MIGAFLTRLPEHKAHPFLIGFLIAAGFLMYALLHSAKVRNFLATKYIHFLGDISYSLYALHFLVLASLTSYLGLIWQGHLELHLIVSIYLISTIVLFIMSYFAWKWVDRPGIQMSKKFSRYFL